MQTSLRRTHWTTSSLDKRGEVRLYCRTPLREVTGFGQDPIEQKQTFTVNNLLDKPQLGELLHVSVKTLDKWVCDREIPFVKVGRLVRFRPEEIDAWLDERRVPVAA